MGGSPVEMLPRLLPLPFIRSRFLFPQLLPQLWIGTPFRPPVLSFCAASIHPLPLRMPSWEECITTDPDVCHGKPSVKGTRVTVSVILDNLAEGLLPEEIAKEYPALTPADVQASLAYAATLTRENAPGPAETNFADGSEPQVSGLAEQFREKLEEAGVESEDLLANLDDVKRELAETNQ